MSQGLIPADAGLTVIVVLGGSPLPPEIRLGVSALKRRGLGPPRLIPADAGLTAHFRLIALTS